MMQPRPDMILISRFWLLLHLVAGATVADGQRVKSVSNTSQGLEQRQNVFVIAHQDDWQVFLGDIVAQALRSGSPVRFIYLTAGDGGRDSVYWQTREGAALQSTRVAAQLPAADSSKCAPVLVMEHTIRKCILGGTESYFLRLPDGRRNGAGFPRRDHQSMRRLRAKKIAGITAIDGSATYRGWEDLVSTVGELLNGSSGQPSLVNTTDPSIVANPHDHFDHRMAGLLVAELKKRRTLNVRYYVGYALATRAANRSNEQAREKTAIFRAYDEEMMRINKNWSAYKEHPSFYSECMLRTYARTPRVR